MLQRLAWRWTEVVWTVRVIENLVTRDNEEVVWESGSLRNVFPKDPTDFQNIANGSRRKNAKCPVIKCVSEVPFAMMRTQNDHAGSRREISSETLS